MRPIEHRSILKFVIFGVIVFSAITSVVVYNYRRDIVSIIKSAQASRNTTLPEEQKPMSPEMQLLNSEGIEIIMPTDSPEGYTIVTPTTVPTIAL
jgi:hypothetical protein